MFRFPPTLLTAAVLYNIRVPIASHVCIEEQDHQIQEYKNSTQGTGSTTSSPELYRTSKSNRFKAEETQPHVVSDVRTLSLFTLLLSSVEFRSHPASLVLRTPHSDSLISLSCSLSVLVVISFTFQCMHIIIIVLLLDESVCSC